MNHGTVNYEGKELNLTEEAYATNYRDYVRYEAHAADANGNTYLVQWDTTSEWDNDIEAAQADTSVFPVKLDDESNACDWANPVEITELEVTEKTYYFPDDKYLDAICGATPICIDVDEIQRLANEWEMPVETLMRQVHEANECELEKYGHA